MYKFLFINFKTKLKKKKFNEFDELSKKNFISIFIYRRDLKIFNYIYVDNKFELRAEFRDSIFKIIDR